MYVCTYVRMCAYVYICMYGCMSMYVLMYTCMHVCICIHVYVCVCVCACAFGSTCSPKCTGHVQYFQYRHIYIYIKHIYIYTCICYLYTYIQMIFIRLYVLYTYTTQTQVIFQIVVFNSQHGSAAAGKSCLIKNVSQGLGFAALEFRAFCLKSTDFQTAVLTCPSVCRIQCVMHRFNLDTCGHTLCSLFVVSPKTIGHNTGHLVCSKIQLALRNYLYICWLIM